MKRRTMTVTEIVRVRELLQEHLVRTDRKTEAGVHTWRYETGWHDEAVARAVAPDLGRFSVARVRAELFGPIKGAVVEKPNGAWRPKVSDERVAALETRVTWLERLVRYLCAELGVSDDVNIGT